MELNVCPSSNHGVNIKELPCSVEDGTKVIDFKCQCFNPKDIVFFGTLRGILEDSDSITPSKPYENIFVLNKKTFQRQNYFSLRIDDKNLMQKISFHDRKVIVEGLSVIDNNGKHHLLYGFVEDTLNIKENINKFGEKNGAVILDYWLLKAESKNRFIIGKDNQTVLLN